MENRIKILETLRDAIQGWYPFIPTGKKVGMINEMLEVGFDIIDVGSFVSKKAIPQLADTGDVLRQLNFSKSNAEILVLCANPMGAEMAAGYESIHIIAFPFSTSETFLKKNINAGFDKGWKILNQVQNTCVRSKKKLIVYLTMAFGNPYGDPVSLDIIHQWVERLSQAGISLISLSDVIAAGETDFIGKTYALLTRQYPEIEFGMHLHIRKNDGMEKIDAAWKNGCSIFEGVIAGVGGCPMTGYELVNNLPTRLIVEYARQNTLKTNINYQKFFSAQKKAIELFS